MVLRRTQISKSFWRVNQNIKAPTLRVIGPDGRQMGVFSLQEALVKAQEENLDLVEIAPHANPPVAKIIEFAKFKYREEKREREAKKKEKKGSEQKEIWFSPFMAGNDYTVKAGRVKEFLKEGYKVRVAVRFKGQQMGHKEAGYKIVKKLEEDTKDVGKIEQQPKFLGRQLMTTLTPVK